MGQKFRLIRLKGIVAIFGLSALVSMRASAREYQDLFPTPKGRSMGGAMTAIADDSNSIQYNPAGLAQIETWQLRLPDLVQAYGSSSIFTIFKSIKALSGVGESQFANKLREFDGTGASFGVDLMGLGWFRNRMGIMLNPVSVNTSLRIRTPSIFFAKINARMIADGGLSMGYGHPFLSNHLRAGVTLRPFLVRGSFENQFEGASIASIDANTLKDKLGFGWGFDADMGIQGNLDPITIFGFDIKPMAGIAFQNLLATQYSHLFTANVNGKPIPALRRVNVGIAASVENMGVFKPTLSLELRNIGIRTDAFLEHVAIAAEFLLKPRKWFSSALRAHFAQGNVGGGLGGHLWFGEMELGTYVVNLGKGMGVGPDRRLYLSLSSAF